MGILLFMHNSSVGLTNLYVSITKEQGISDIKKSSIYIFECTA